MESQLRTLIHELQDLHSEMVNLADENLSVLAAVHPENQSSAANLIHYLALRRHDVRGLQEQLAALGLSSLGRTESHVLSGVRAVLKILSLLDQGAPVQLQKIGLECDGEQGRRLLEQNTELLLGAPPEDRRVRIMVTMPS